MLIYAQEQRRWFIEKTCIFTIYDEWYHAYEGHQIDNFCTSFVISTINLICLIYGKPFSDQYNFELSLSDLFPGERWKYLKKYIIFIKAFFWWRTLKSFELRCNLISAPPAMEIMFLNNVINNKLHDLVI